MGAWDYALRMPRLASRCIRRVERGDRLRVVHAEEAPNVVITRMQSLIGGYSLHPLDETTDDTEQERSSFAIEQQVGVLGGPRPSE